MEVEDIPAGALEEIASVLTITDHATGAPVPWVPNSEQKKMWRAGQEHRFVYALKPRQIGISTSQLLKDLIFTVHNAQRGVPVNTWIVWDTDAKARDKQETIMDFCRQLRFEFIKRDNQLLFPTRGTDKYSVIEAFTAGGKRAGAGLSTHRIHISELPAWQDGAGTFTSLMQCLNQSGKAEIETTMLLGSSLSKRLWYGCPGNGWEQVFFGVEDHDEYKLPISQFQPDHLDLPREFLVGEMGFTCEETMAFIQWAFTALCDGDIHALLREYPNTPESAFASADGRWVRKSPPVLPSVGHRVGEHTLEIFIPPEETSGQCIIAVDTAGGLGKDRSAIAVMDRKDGRLCATFVDEWATVEDLVAVAKAAQDLYTRQDEPEFAVQRSPAPRIPLAIIEDNGIGLATVQEAVKRGLIYRAVHQKAGSTYNCLLKARLAVEGESVMGPLALTEECDELSVDKGKFRGHKDLLVCIGLCLQDIGDTRFQAPREVEPTNVFRADLKKRARWSKY